MRHHYVLVGALALAACGGGGPNSIGSNAAPTGSVGGSATTDTFVNPSTTHTYSAIGGVQSYQYKTSSQYGNQRSQLYAGDASTARNSGITVTYDPRSAIFELKIADSAAGVSQSLTFQDPVHRTAFGGEREPQNATPNIANQAIQYLQAGGTSPTAEFDPTSGVLVGPVDTSSNIATFFYQKPGTSTQYVTFAGYLRNETNVALETNPANPNQTYLVQSNTFERAVFAFGQRTGNGSVPKTGSGSFTGNMLATMVNNPLLDADRTTPSYFQWISGTSKIDVDFGASTVSAAFNGKVFAPQLDAYTSGVAALPGGTTFAATGTARIDLVNAGEFVGSMDSAKFTPPSGTTQTVAVTGSSLDGAFYGPAAEEVGGGFRIVGGTPDQRVDILGTFTAAKPK